MLYDQTILNKHMSVNTSLQTSSPSPIHSNHPGFVENIKNSIVHLVCPYKDFTFYSNLSQIKKIIYLVESFFMNTYLNLPLGFFAPRYSFPAKYMKAFDSDYEKQLDEALSKKNYSPGRPVFPFTSKKEYLLYYNKLIEVAKKFDFDEKDIYFLDASNVMPILGATQGFSLGYSKPIIMLDFSHISNLEELEGIVAHEFAHIRKNHALKMFPLIIILLAVTFLASNFIQFIVVIPLCLTIIKISIIFEKQADLLAAKKVGTKGLIKTFENVVSMAKNNYKAVSTRYPIFKLLKRLQYTAEGNNRFDFQHPALTERIKYLKEFEQNQTLIKK